MIHTATDPHSVSRETVLSCRHRGWGRPVVAFTALAIAFGCSSDNDDAATNVPGEASETAVEQNGASDNGAGSTASPNGSTSDQMEVGGEDNVDRVDEGNPNASLDLAEGTGEPAATGNEGTEPGDAPLDNAFVEDNGLDCEIGALPGADDLQELTTLPDPFLGLNGERITTREQWRCRRQEIRKLAEGFIYGEKPAAPESVTGSVTDNSITVNVENQGQTVSFSASITLPPGATGPVPAVIGYGGSSFQDAILDEGVAFINYNIGDVGDETTRNPKQGAFYTAYPDNQDSGMLVAWAWGVSRMLDIIEQSDSQIIDPQGIGVHGCSRSGKGAFIAGAFDERVALTIPFESGMSGVPAFRMIVPEGGEVLRNTIEYRPWAGDTYQQFLVLGAGQDEPDLQVAQNNQSGQLQFRLPLDTHEVIGMVAPRGLLVLGNPSIVNLAPRAEHVTVLAGAEIYSALGVAENISYISDTANGNHCSFRQEFVPQLQQNLRKFLKKDASATTGAIEPAGNFTGQDLASNIDWETPVLQ